HTLVWGVLKQHGVPQSRHSACVVVGSICRGRAMRLLARSLRLLLLLRFARVGSAIAQREPPARVGRVSIVSGALAFFGPGDDDWSAARVNLPVAAGAWLATDPQTRAEIRVGAASVDLANDTQLNIAELRGKLMQLAL